MSDSHGLQIVGTPCWPIELRLNCVAVAAAELTNQSGAFDNQLTNQRVQLTVASIM